MQILGIRNNHSLVCFYVVMLMLQVESKPHEMPQEVGDECVLKNAIPGICTETSMCPQLEQRSKQMGLKETDIANCGFTVMEEIICCPNVTRSSSRDSFRPGVQLKSGEQTPSQKAEEACRRISESDEPDLVPLVIGGDAVKPGEYPHMVAIGYQGTKNQPHQFVCGGSLIDKRFVLTAAHCDIPEKYPSRIVRLGIADMEDPQQLRDSLDMPIKHIHLHPNFNELEQYNDIAIIELEKEVEYTRHIFPACLYTEPSDPPLEAELNVTGWGVMNTSTGIKSTKLLKARVNIFALKKCQEYYDQSPTALNVMKTQLCTLDDTYQHDACKGDSGGPLNLIVDAMYRKMRIVGIVSAGIGCAGRSPSLYTRVASYLDFIARIVWP